MKRCIIVLCLFLLLIGTILEAAQPRSIILVPGLNNRNAHALEMVVPGLWLDKVTGEGAVYYAGAAELARLDFLNVEYRVLWADERDRARRVRELTGMAWPKTSYLAMRAWMQDLAATYPDISRYHVFGTSVDGRDLVALEITDFPDTDDPLEPEVRMLGNIHGDEYMSLELMCLLADDLCVNYGTDPQVTSLVDNFEIWVMPSINPDGHEYGTRANAHGVDLNRNHGYMWRSGYGSGPFSEIELQHWYSNAIERNYSLSLTFHGETTYFNYPWNFTGRDAVDKLHLINLGRGYAALDNGYTVVEGYDWYQVNGDTNDWSYGVMGDFDVTIETPGYSEPEIATDWDDNQEAIRYYINEAQYGVRGIVTDTGTLAPLHAVVRVVEKERWPVYTDPVAGDYHRPLTTGTYTLEAWANGYQTNTIGGVSVTSGSTTVQNIQLVPSPTIHAFQIVWNRIDSFYANNFSYPDTWDWDGWAHYALGPPDEVPGCLGRNSELCLDMGEGFDIPDISGDDFTVIEADTGDGDETCTVYGSNDPFGAWTLIGSATGTTVFDISGTGLTSVRYLRFVDDGDGSYYGDWPGYDLDAVTCLAPITATPTVTVTATSTVSLTPLITPTVTVTLTLTLTQSPIPTDTPAHTFTPAPSSTYSPVPTTTNTPTASPTSTMTITSTSSMTHTISPTHTPTMTLTLIPTRMPTATRTPTPTKIPPTFTAVPTAVTPIPVAGPLGRSLLIVATGFVSMILVQRKKRPVKSNTGPRYED